MSINADKPAATGAVLVVDDDPAIRRSVQRFLVRLGHRVGTASSSAEALEQIGGDSYDLIITDLQMPVSSGLELLAEVRARCPEMRTILMSGRADASDAAAAIDHGVDRLLLKPFQLDRLQDAVEKSLEERRAQLKSVRDGEMFSAMVRQRETQSKIWILRAAHALAAAVEAKDAYTAGHATRVTGYAMSIGEAVGGIDVPGFRLAGNLHDVGKIGVPDAVLNKPGRLNEEELALVQKHPEVGARILEPLIDDPLVVSVVRWHHERWDGGGYPDRLAGDRIPLAARVLAVADTLDAMTSSRAYREGLPWKAAVDEIRRCAGTQFDPRVVDAFDAALPMLEALHTSFLSDALRDL